MTAWEYAEVEWPLSVHDKATWHGADRTSIAKDMPGLQVLQEASQDGWEVIGYRTGSERGHWSVALLRRAVG